MTRAQGGHEGSLGFAIWVYCQGSTWEPALERTPRDDRLTVGLAALAMLLGWAWSWVGIRSAVRHLPPGVLALARLAVASLVLGVVWLARGRRLPEPRDWPGIALTGVLGFATYGLCINAGEKIIPAGTASMVVAGIPVLTTLGAVLFLGERLSLRGWTGVLTAFGGMLIIAAGQPGGRAELVGLLLLIGGALSATAYNLLSKRYLARYSALDLTTWAIWTGTLGLLPVGGGLSAAWQAAPASAHWTVVALGVVPSAICYSLFAYIIAHRSLARAASLLFLVPVIAVVMGYLILGEQPALASLLGGAVVIGGVWLVSRR